MMAVKKEYVKRGEFVPGQGDVLKFQEHPELEAAVKEKIADVIENRGGRQVISTRDGIRYLKKHFGPEMTALLCSIEDKVLISFMRTKSPATPSPLQARNIAAAYVIADILLSHLDTNIVKDWLIDYSDYLGGFPAIELGRRPEDVRMAAMYLVARTEI